MISDFSRGVSYLFQGFSLIRTPGLKRYAIFPILINVIVFGSLVWFTGGYISELMDNWLPDWLDFAIIKYLLWTFFGLATFIVVFYTFSLLANFIAAPFNGLLAERVERHLTGRTNGDDLSILRTVLLAFGSQAQKLLYLAVWVIPFGLLMLVPIANLVIAVLWFLFSAWLISLEYLDYPMGNHGLSFKAQRKLAAEKRWLVLGFGTMTVALTAIPIVNLFVMPAAVAGATKLWLEKLPVAARIPPNQNPQIENA